MLRFFSSTYDQDSRTLFIHQNKTLCQIFLSKSYLESKGYEKEKNMKIKDAMLKRHEPKKRRENNGYSDACQKERTMGAKTPARENKR
jgi:hypothetical protein